MKNITGIIVCYNTAELLADCYFSLRNFYPELPLIIVDNSDTDDECYEFCNGMEARDGRLRVIHTHENIGHGPGMKRGIAQCGTEYFVLIDSDTVMERGGVLELMLDVLSAECTVYGVGQVVAVDGNGSNVSAQCSVLSAECSVPGAEHRKPSTEHYDYLHPHFCLINKEVYHQYPAIVHHGAPMLRAMQARPVVVNFAVGDYVRHVGRGTRSVDPKWHLRRKWE